MSVIDIRRCAVLCIDLQNDYRSDGAYPVAGYDAVLQNTASLISAARGAGVSIIHVQGWIDDAARQAYPLLDGSIRDETRSAVAGSPGAELCHEVRPHPGEVVVRKVYPSSFKGTTLGGTLRQRGIEHLITVGVWSDSCVRATVIDAIEHNFRIWLVKDACGSATTTMHRTAVLDMANRLYGGGVLRTAEAQNALRCASYDVWRCSRPIEFVYDLATVDALYHSI